MQLTNQISVSAERQTRMREYFDAEHFILYL